MWRHAARAVPWTGVGLAAVLVLGLMELLSRHPGPMWPLQGAAVGVVAGAVACCLDEVAAPVVDVSPRGLAWRTAARSGAVLLLLGVWSAAVWRSRDALLGTALEVTAQGHAAALIALAWVTWRRSTGSPQPGARFAAAVVPAALIWGMGPWAAEVPLFPAPYADEWAASNRIWSVLAALAVVGLVSVLGEPRRRFGQAIRPRNRTRPAR